MYVPGREVCQMHARISFHDYSRLHAEWRSIQQYTRHAIANPIAKPHSMKSLLVVWFMIWGVLVAQAQADASEFDNQLLLSVRSICARTVTQFLISNAAA